MLKFPRKFLPILVLLAAAVAHAQPEAGSASTESEESTAPAGKSGISYVDGVILGVVEGITEYLPISSTGHLILTNQLLGLDRDEPLYDREGAAIFLDDTDPDTGGKKALTLEGAANAYAIIIQGGAIAAVAIIYWRRLLVMVSGGIAVLKWLTAGSRRKETHYLSVGTKGREGALLVRNLLVAFLPAAVFGLLFDEMIEEFLFGVWPVVIALFAGALLMFGVEAWRKRRPSYQHAKEGPDLHEMDLRQCLIIGLLQCVAMWPGTSRSMMTIVGGYVVGLNPVRAAEFSFLLGFVTLTAAAGYKTLQMGGPMLQALDIGPVIVGILVATVSAALAVKWLVSYLTKHGLSLFAWYRIALAAAVAALMIEW